MKRLAVLFLALAAAAPLAAQAAHTDFSGKWVLDLSKLDGPMAQAGITSAIVTITQDSATMKQDQSMSSAMGSQNVSVVYALNGSDSKNTVTQGPMSLDMVSTAAWDGPSLVITTKTDFQGNPYIRTDRYSLDASGKVLTIDSNISVMGQSVSAKQTFNKG